MDSPPRRRRKSQLPPSLVSLAQVFHGLRPAPKPAQPAFEPVIDAVQEAHEESEEGQAIPLEGHVGEPEQEPVVASPIVRPFAPIRRHLHTQPDLALPGSDSNSDSQNTVKHLQRNPETYSEQEVGPSTRSPYGPSLSADVSPLPRTQHHDEQIAVAEMPLRTPAHDVSVDDFLSSKPKQYRGRKYQRKGRQSATKPKLTVRKNSLDEKTNPEFIAKLKGSRMLKKALVSDSESDPEHQKTAETEGPSSDKSRFKVLRSLPTQHLKKQNKKAPRAPIPLPLAPSSSDQDELATSGTQRRIKRLPPATLGTKNFVRGIADTSFASSSSGRKQVTVKTDRQQKTITSRAFENGHEVARIARGAGKKRDREARKDQAGGDVRERKQLELVSGLKSPPSSSSSPTAFRRPPLPVAARPKRQRVPRHATSAPPVSLKSALKLNRSAPPRANSPAQGTATRLELSPVREEEDDLKQLTSKNPIVDRSPAEVAALLPTPPAPKFRFVTGHKAKRTPTLKYFEGWPTTTSKSANDDLWAEASDDEEVMQRPKKRLLLGPSSYDALAVWGEEGESVPDDVENSLVGLSVHAEDSIEFIIDHESPYQAPPRPLSPANYSDHRSSPAECQNKLPVVAAQRRVSFSPVVRELKLSRSTTNITSRVFSSSGSTRATSARRSRSVVAKFPLSSGNESSKCASKRMRRLSLLTLPILPPRESPQQNFSSPLNDEGQDIEKEAHATHASSHSYNEGPSESLSKLSPPPPGQRPHSSLPPSSFDKYLDGESHSFEARLIRADGHKQELDSQALWLKGLDPLFGEEDTEEDDFFTRDRTRSPATSQRSERLPSTEIA